MYSTTQAGNLAIIAGAIALILAKFGYSIGSDEIQLLIGAVLIVGAAGVSWYKRYKKGDLTLGGFRKS